jgi:hypothetical protein
VRQPERGRQVSGEQVQRNTFTRQWLSQAWWCTSIIPALGQLRQEAPEIKANLKYIARPCLQKTNKQKNRAVVKSCEIISGMV